MVFSEQEPNVHASKDIDAQGAHLRILKICMEVIWFNYINLPHEFRHKSLKVSILHIVS